MNTHIFGNQGEALAKKYLVKNKYKILETNYVNPIGEIDIIAQDKDTIVFVEVKARSSTKFGFPREAVTPFKQNKIRKVALGYLKFTNNLDAKIRFDCIEILGDQLTHIKNCF